jgi:hypothetical protein
MDFWKLSLTLPNLNGSLKTSRNKTHSFNHLIKFLKKSKALKRARNSCSNNLERLKSPAKFQGAYSTLPTRKTPFLINQIISNQRGKRFRNLWSPLWKASNFLWIISIKKKWKSEINFLAAYKQIRRLLIWHQVPVVLMRPWKHLS